MAVLKGHTSSVKSATYFDPSRSYNDPTALAQSSIVASGGRDGNILIFDIRCKGREGNTSSPGSGSDSGGSSPSRDDSRYSTGVPGFAPSRAGSAINPVMVIRQAHGDGSRRLASVVSVIVLRLVKGFC